VLDPEASSRLNLLRFPLIVGVVFIHAYESTVNLAGQEVGVSETGFLADFIRNFLSQGVARTAVPLFFLISGYLFFSKFEWSRRGYLLKLSSRVKTLLIPFLFWNIAAILVVAIAQAIPSTATYFSGKKPSIASFEAFDYINAVVGLNRNPIAYQFWFIRDLMILVVLAPILRIALKFCPVPFLCILFISWFLRVWPGFVPSVEASLFFSVGAYLAIVRQSLFALDRHGRLCAILYLVMVVFDALSIDQPLNPYLHRLGILLGIVSALYATKLLAHREKPNSVLLGLSSSSFFVFAMHEPLLTILRKVSYRLASPDSSLLVLFLYFAVPIAVIFLSLIIYRKLVDVAPGFTSIITGGR
jgi:surface polysaccharide O-acyltransferase-like enzyme